MPRHPLTADASESCLVVVAHPDDEVVGAGIWLHRQAGARVTVLHITDGSPRDMQDARAVGFSSRKAYALARRRELSKALDLIGIPRSQCVQFPFVDKEAYVHFEELIERVGSCVAKLRPTLVLSHAYEGGHPDHDAAALAVAAVRERYDGFRHWEFPLYHAGSEGEMVVGQFIPKPLSPKRAGRPICELRLSPPECALKSRMLACFRTQKDVLVRFRVGYERFREAPRHNFAEAPHPGQLLYESWGWGISGKDWRARAADAIASARVFSS